VSAAASAASACCKQRINSKTEWPGLVWHDTSRPHQGRLVTTWGSTDGHNTSLSYIQEKGLGRVEQASSARFHFVFGNNGESTYCLTHLICLLTFARKCLLFSHQSCNHLHTETAPSQHQSTLPMQRPVNTEHFTDQAAHSLLGTDPSCRCTHQPTSLHQGTPGW